jgi:signal transduction histidine kinase
MPLLTRARTTARALAAVAFFGSAGVLLIWRLGSTPLVATLSLMMKANTSLSLVLLSAALWLVVQEPLKPVRRWGSSALAVAGALVGALSLLQYFTGQPLGIDELVRADVPAPESLPYPGRMAPNTALGLVFFGLGVLLLDFKSRWSRKASDLLFAVVMLMGSIALVGYLFQVSELYRIAQHLRMSQYTAGSLVLLCTSAYLARPERPTVRFLLSSAPESYLIQRLLPAALFTPILFCFIAVKVRTGELVNRPTSYSLLAVALAVAFSSVVWVSARTLEKGDRERRRLVEQERATLATINTVGQAFVSELNLEKVVQSVTDAATQLLSAQFGAFFYNVVNTVGESYSLYTLSGVPKDAFAKFPMPRNTAVFQPTFLGKGTLRSDDITKDPRYGHNAPYRGMPEGHLPVRSYLAVSVVSRSGEVLGGLFFGHSEVGKFSENSERLVEGLAAQAAIALDNARLYQKLQESVRVRDEFLSIASHELKTPLTSLMLQNDILQRQLASGLADRQPELLRTNVDKQRRQFHRLGRLIDDMLDLSRINLGKLSLEKERFDLRELITEVVERHRPQFEAAGGELTLAIEGEAVGTWDRLRLEQLLTNLFTNAIRYGRGRPVNVALRVDGARARLEVRDQGIGIAQKDHERIFQRFERAVSASDVSGLGLGLYIAREIAVRHGGTLRVESAPEQGACFIAELPLASTTAEQLNAA